MHHSMQRATHIFNVAIGANPTTRLPRVALYALLLCCPACLRHKNAQTDGFRLINNQGAAWLVPVDHQDFGSGDFQTSLLVLPGSSAHSRDQTLPSCEVNGEIFSIRSASNLDARRWIVRSPGISGWNALATKIDIDAEWKKFTRGLARMNENGCFPSGFTAAEIRGAVASRLMLPAEEVLFFLNADKDTGFVDLMPGMEVTLQQFLPVMKSGDASTQASPQLWIATYETLRADGKGTRLRLIHNVRAATHNNADHDRTNLLSLSQRFASTPALRLFLEGVYGTGKVSHAILIGATNQEQLDTLTDLIRASDPARCSPYQGTACAEFPLGSLSLFSTVWVNGHRASCLFGSSLADFLKSLPSPRPDHLLNSAHVLRRASSGHYAEVVFPRNADGAAHLLLLPGDKVVWRY